MTLEEVCVGGIVPVRGRGPVVSAKRWILPFSPQRRNRTYSPLAAVFASASFPCNSKNLLVKAILRINGMLPLEKSANLTVRLSQPIHLQFPRIRQIKRSAAINSEAHQPIDQCVCLCSAIGRTYFVEVNYHRECIFFRCIGKSRFVVGFHIP